MNALDYFLKANLYGLLFVGCYWLFLRRHTFFSLNRVYLLMSAVLSLVLPLASLPTQTVETIETLPGLDWPGLDIPVGVIALPMVVSTPVIPVETGPDWEQIGVVAYGLIALVLLLHLAMRTGRLLWLIRKSPRQLRDSYVLVQPNDPTIPTFSFFHYLVLNPDDTHNSLIIKHELIHIRQFHSGDVLGLAVLRAIFWLCPALWLTDRLLRQVHEFLADKSSSQPTDYARFLIEYTFGVKPDALTNGFFNPSLLKQRILMLHQKATTRWALGKYVLVLPLALGLLAMTTAREEIAAVVSQATDETITVSGRVTGVDGKPLAGANVVIATTGKGTPTDQRGFYKLANVPVTATLAYSHVGYRTDLLHLEALSQRAKNNQLKLNPRLTPNLQDELPAMGATAAYKAIKPNLSMPIRTPPSSQTINGEVFTAVEEPAVFPTGIPGLMQYVAHALRYPAKAKSTGIQGDVFVQFVVLPTGYIGSATIKKGIGNGCDEEALRVVRKMPKWIPAKQNGKSVASQYVVPIQFALEKNEDKRTGQLQGNQLSDVYVTAYESPVQLTPDKPTSQTTRNGEVFTVVEQVPEFPGGTKALGQYLSRNLRYPTEARQNGIQGRVYVQFVVSPTGEIRNLRVMQGIGGGCDEEAVRVISQMPKWNPGHQRGRAVDVQSNLAVQFELEPIDDKRTGNVVTPQPDSSKKTGFILDNSKNRRFALYDDITMGNKERYSIPLPDSLQKSTSALRVRNFSSFSDKPPLYILDGIEIRADRLKTLEPSEIENMSVLKTSAATAIYGAKAINGVVLITTKKK